MRKKLFSSLFVALLAISSQAVFTSNSAFAQDVAVSSQMAGKVSLNSADSATLQRELAGVGKAKADAIVAHRDANGAFASIDELLEVKGIGKALLDKNRQKLELN